MRALVYRSYGGPEVVEIGDRPEPHAGPGEIRIAVRAASVNPLDWKMMSGMRAEGEPLAEPAGLGFDGAGVVDEIGPDVDGVSVGDEVFGRGHPTAAEHAVLDSWASKPDSVDWAVAGGAGVAGETSDRCLRLLGVGAGDTVFVDGGSGGVGTVAVQLAVARGLRVVASAGPGNQDYLREIGAIPVFYGEGVADRVREAAEGQVAGVLDAVGKTPIEDLVGLVAEPGQVVTIANYGAGSAGAQVAVGPAGGSPVAALAEVAGLLADGRLQIPVQTFSFDQAQEAYRESLAGHVRGKLVLVP